MNQQEHRNATFNQFIKLLADCERHPGEVANMIVIKEEVEPRGLVCGLCLFGAEGAKAKELQPKSLKLMLLQIHQSCSALLANVPASAFVDHHINLIRGVAKTHFKEMEANLQPAIAVYFQRIRELLNGKYFH